MEIEDHYSQLLGTQEPWEISKVDLDMSAHRVDIEIEYTDVTGACPECGANCPKHDDRKPRSWRHLDTMQFATCLHCSVPRACLLRQVRCRRMAPGRLRFRGPPGTAVSLCFLKVLQSGCYKPPAALKRRVSGQV